MAKPLTEDEKLAKQKAIDEMAERMQDEIKTKYQFGDKYRTVANAASHFGCTYNLMWNVYQVLKKRGYIRTEPLGTYVKEPPF